jgi:phosphoglycerate dehydrogenase-like enzyme
VAKVVVTDSAELLRPAIETFASEGEPIEVMPDGLTGEQVAERAADAEVLVIGIMHMRRPAIEKLPDTVGLLIRCGIGVDVIDVAAATDHGIWVANVPDYCVEEVADHTVLLMLSAARQLRHFEHSWHEGRWASLDYKPVRRLAGQTLGLIGLGRIGAEVARRARGFGLNIIAADEYVPAERFASVGAERVTLDELFERSDIISLHAPLGAGTQHLLNAAAFAKMRDGVVIVNASRGGLIDHAALDAALESGKVRAAGLDVLEGEPTPDLAAPLLQRPNVIVTPHVAWYSQDARRELGIKAAQEALRYVRRERPRNLINPDARSAPGTPAGAR